MTTVFDPTLGDIDLGQDDELDHYVLEPLPWEPQPTKTLCGQDIGDREIVLLEEGFETPNPCIVCVDIAKGEGWLV